MTPPLFPFGRKRRLDDGSTPAEDVTTPSAATDSHATGGPASSSPQERRTASRPGALDWLPEDAATPTASQPTDHDDAAGPAPDRVPPTASAVTTPAAEDGPHPGSSVLLPAPGPEATAGNSGTSGSAETAGSTDSADSADSAAHAEPASSGTEAPGSQPHGPASAGDAGDTVTEPARNLLEEALAAWREELAELGGVASLDDASVLDGVASLDDAHPSGLAQLYAGRATHLSSLVRERSALAVARQALREVAGRSDVLARQFGVAPVYLALGVATWSEAVPTDAGEEEGEASSAVVGTETTGPDTKADQPLPAPARRTVNAPVLLRPVRLAATGGDATLALGPSIEVNPVLTRALREAGCRTDVDAIARGALSDIGFTPRAALTRLGSLGRQYLTDFSLHERLVVGAFVHPGQALVEDFDATVDRARASALVAALAGDPAAREALAVPLAPPRPTDREPDAERGVGDLDVAQLDAVEAVSSGASILLDAPPGSDVAATLAAVLADAAASGRTVLHVPATSADGHAVADVLREQGLGDLVIDLTEDPGWRLHAAEAIKDSLGVEPPELDVPTIVAQREELAALREEMTQAVAALHAPRAPWGVSAYEALGHLAEFTTGRARRYTSARVAAGHLERLDEAGLARATDLLHRAEDLDLLTPEGAGSAWKGVVVTDIDQATDALAHLTRLADELLPALTHDVPVTAELTGVDPALTVNQWLNQLAVLDEVRDCLDVFLPEVFERSAADMIIATATKQWRAEHAVEMSGSTRRRFTKQAKDLVRPGRPVADLHAELVKVQRRREAWRALHPSSGWPRVPADLDAMLAAAQATAQALAALQPLLDTTEDAPVLMDLPLGELERLVSALADDDATAQRLPEVNQVLGGLAELGLNELVADLAAREVHGKDLESELMYCWWASLLASLLREDPSLAGLGSGVLGERAARLRELDATQAQTLAGPLLHAYASRVRGAVEADKTAARALYVALSRDDGVPLREILASHPLAMTVKPVWIVPPTLVPQVFTPDAVVDLAVLDASVHMPVAQVLPAFVRAEQVLVVGDPRREESGLAAELGSLLPAVVLSTTRNTLDGPIASFLATHGYGDVVEAIPSPPGAVNLSLDLVDGRGMPAPGQTAVESVPTEVDRVVDLVLEHALTRPEESLGVVALSARHAEQIRRAVAQAVAGSPALEQFFAAGIAEPFVVVDLSEARSLRRDRIIISVGYAKTPHGRTIHSFGAVSQVGGMVGLVEALCAARGATVVVSCLAAEDIDPERLHSAGSQLLREMLVRAAQPGEAAAQGGQGQPDPLLVDLAERLWRKGLTVVPRYGLEGGPRIPLAIGHPDYPGELLVAVLTDDAAYVAEESLRRRDRYWEQRLRARGWLVYTTYSVSLFVDPEAEASAIEQMVLDVLVARQAEQAAREAAAQPVVVEADPTTGEVLEAGEGTTTQGAAATTPADASAPGTDGDAPATDGDGPAWVPLRASAGRGVRAQRPPLAKGLPLQAYSDDQLDEMVTWIRSDGVERSVEEEVEVLREELALRRRGAGVDAVLTHAVTRSRR